MTDWRDISLLIVDDETDLLEIMVQRFRRKGCNVTGSASGDEALALLEAQSFDAGIYDINLPGMDGVQLLRATKESNPNMEVIMLTGHGTVDTAIETMKLGAYDYLRKPYALSELEVIVARALEKKKLTETNQGLTQALLAENNKFSIIGQSAAMKNLLDLTLRLADSDISVLIEGESGTGKELIARALHFWSSRAEQPFIAVNAGALPEHLLESELFGHVKGAFTGAISDKKGLVEVADRGTLFLDEIGEMPFNLQIKLLRFLESQEFRRIGDSRLRKVKVRVVTATNRILQKEVAKGNFREDLFYRLNVMKLSLAPLRDRPDDIPLLVQHFLGLYARGQQVTLASGALDALSRYSFPGNVRELAHMIERGIVLARGGEITLRDLLVPDLDADAGGMEEAARQLVTLAQVEKNYIRWVMERCTGNKTQAAKALGISVRNLYRKLEEYKL